MKKDKFLFRVAEDLLERFENDLQNVAIVFNNKRPQLFLKKYLSELSGKPIWSPHLYTIQQFFSGFTSQVCASPLKQFFVLFSEYNMLLRSEGKELVSADVFYPLAEVIVSDFSQIDYYLADPAKVFNLIGSIAELQHQFPNFEEEQLEFMKSFWSSFSGEKQSKTQEKFIEMWHRMPVLYGNFHGKLAEQNLVSSAKMYRNLAEGTSADQSFLNQFSHVVFVGFNALSKAEELLFKGWQDQGICSFYFDADEHYFDDLKQEAGHFIRRNINKIGLINQFPITGNRVNDANKEFTVVQALGNAAQGKLLGNLLSSTPAGDADTRAIILADEALLLPVLQTVSDDNLNITMGYPFEQSAVFGLCDLWLDIQEEIASGDQRSIPYHKVLNFIFNPLINLDDQQRNRINAEIVEKKKSRFDLLDLRGLGKSAELSFSHYRNPSDTIRNFGSLLLIVSEQLEHLRKLDSLLIAEAVKTLNVLSDSFEELEQSTGVSSMGSKFVFRTIRRALAGLTVPFDGEPLSGLQVMGLLESRCLDFDELIVLGMNEGVLPKISITPSFIPDNVRRAFGLPVLENQNSIFSYFFYRLLHCAKKVTLVYNGITDDDKSTGEESRFIKQLQFETNCQFKHLVQQNQPLQNYGEQKIIVGKTGLVRERLEKYLQRNPEIKYEKKISATAFTDYVSCPLKFFYSRIAGLKEPSDLPDQIGANLVGTMLHTVMESFYRSSVGSEVSAEFIKLQAKDLPAMCLNALAVALNMGSKNPLQKRDALQQVVLKVIEHYALRILKHDEGLAPFTIIEVENRESYTPLFNIQVSGKKEQVRLIGIIDRVDSKQGKVRIVDYKTGKDKLKYKDFESLFSEEGKDQNKALIQTLFYTYVYETSKAVKNVEPHLYTVKDFKNGTLFSEKKKGGLQLSDQNLEYFKEQFELILSEKLHEIFDLSIPFVQTTNLDACKYCDFKKICQR